VFAYSFAPTRMLSVRLFSIALGDTIPLVSMLDSHLVPRLAMDTAAGALFLFTTFILAPRGLLLPSCRTRTGRSSDDFFSPSFLYSNWDVGRPLFNVCTLAHNSSTHQYVAYTVRIDSMYMHHDPHPVISHPHPHPHLRILRRSPARVLSTLLL